MTLLLSGCHKHALESTMFFVGLTTLAYLLHSTKVAIIIARHDINDLGDILVAS